MANANKGLPVVVNPDFIHWKNALPLIKEATKYTSFVSKTVRAGDEVETVYYLNTPLSLDIETTSIEEKDEKYAWMYIWQCEIEGIACYGRTYAEWDEFKQGLIDMFGIDQMHRLMVYVHNLSYEFQFFRKREGIIDTFALDERRPVKSLTTYGFEFRCSYVLSGYGLGKIGEMVGIPKLKGDLDYDKVRHSTTPLTKEEMKYCEYDVRIMGKYLRQKRDEDGDITKILLTKTSYVRAYVKRNTINNPDKQIRNQYRKLISTLTLEPDEYDLAHRAFAGGYTHANPNHVGKIIKNADSIDETSAYPSMLIAFKYPMSKGKCINYPTQKQVTHFSGGNYLSIMDVKIEGLRSKPVADNILSLSKCYNDATFTRNLSVDDVIINNGRIVESFEDVYTSITSIDYEELMKFYEWDKITVIKMYYYVAAPLPTEFVKCIIHFYKLKTTLKGVPGKEDEYQWAKEMLNSLYGMCVTNILRDNIVYALDEWESDPLSDEDIADVISEYNTSKSRFLSYLWGVFCTAYARRAVYSAILEFGMDYLYADTDSNKVINIDKHWSYINNYNRFIVSTIKSALQKHGIDPADAEPVDIKGNKHPLGEWDWETKDHQYLRFMTLGAKRYLVETLDTIKDKDDYGNVIGEHQELVRHMTVAGLPKKAIYDIEKKEGRDGFQIWSEIDITSDDKDGYTIDADCSGKKLITYVDTEIDMDVTDYMGNTNHIHELSYVHMCKNTFDFGIHDRNYRNFLQGINKVKCI